MTTIHLIKSPSALHPSLDADAEIMAKWKTGDIIEATVKRPRNGKFHRKYFALLGVGFNNQDKYETFEDFRMEVQLRAGHYHEHVTLKGTLVPVVDSVSFAKCDEDEFSKLYNGALSVILRWFMQGSTEGEINSAVDQILSFA